MHQSYSSTCGSESHAVHRRRFLQGLFAGSAAISMGGIALADQNAAGTQLRKQSKRALFIWLAGGASQFEMWDPKQSLETGGPFQPISTAVAGFQVCELMPKLAAMTDKLAVVRSLNTKISVHAQAADLMSTGRPKEPAIDYPEIGVLLARELAARDSKLPDYVSFFLTSEGRRRPATGFLGGRNAPLLMEKSLRPQNIDVPTGLTGTEYKEREHLRELLSREFARSRAGSGLVKGYNSAYAKVRGLMQIDHLFDLEREPAELRDRYGRSEFGQQCLLARRLLEAGVPMVKVARGFWDSHHDNFESHRELVPDFDKAMSTLIADLDDRGLLESTLIIVLSEFGRTPKINKDVGRDHFAAAWSCALAGCGINGGSVYGKTDADGKTVVEGEVNESDLAATIYKAAGIDPDKKYQVGQRPVPLARENSVPIAEILS